MYALPNKTQHKLIVKVRGGISQKLDNLTTQTSSSSSNQNSSSPIRSSSLSTLGSKQQIFDEAGFNAELNQLPQPIFHSLHENKNGSKSKSASSSSSSASNQQRSQHKQQYITPEHNEMIKFVSQTWKGVEGDYKRSVNNFINNLDLNSDSSTNDNHATNHHHHNQKSKHTNAKKEISHKIDTITIDRLISSYFIYFKRH